MKITLLEQPVAEPELLIRCTRAEDPQIKRLLVLLEQLEQRIPVHNQNDLTFLSPSEVFYGEFVNRAVFLYTRDAVFPSSLSLARLEQEFSGFLRCSKSMVVNLHQIQRLKSNVNGKIIATLANGECILISRHYAGTLRRELTANR